MTTYMSVLSCISVIGATIAVIVDLSNHKPGFEVINGEMPNKYTLWTAPDATPDKIFGAVTTIMFAFAGHVAFPTFISELKDPKEFPKALAALQITDSTMYAVSAIVMYYYGGQQIKSPALASASAAMKKPILGSGLCDGGCGRGDCWTYLDQVRLCAMLAQQGRRLDAPEDIQSVRYLAGHRVWTLACGIYSVAAHPTICRYAESYRSTVRNTIYLWATRHVLDAHESEPEERWTIRVAD